MSKPLGVDYAAGRISGHALHAAGLSFVCRYLSRDPAKNLTRAEAEQLHAAGVGIVVVWETTADRALAGKSAGIEDAHAALAELAELGAPADQPVYFAVDFDMLGSQVAEVVRYFIGARSVLGYKRTGVYGGIHTVQTIQGVHAKYGWQTLAWSGGELSPAAQLYQFSNGHTVAGVSVDFDRAEHDDYGAWHAPAKAAHQGPRGVARADVGVDLAAGKWGIERRASPIGSRAHFGAGEGVGRWIVEPLPAEGEYWCAKVKVHRGRA